MLTFRDVLHESGPTDCLHDYLYYKFGKISLPFPERDSLQRCLQNGKQCQTVFFLEIV